MVKVGKLQRVAQEEHWRIVSHKVPVALIRIEFHCKPSDVAFCISCSPLTSHGRKPYKTLRLLAYLAEHCSSCIFRYVMRHGKRTVCPCTLCMHTPFWYHLTVEMGQLLYQPRVLHHYRSSPTCRLRVLVVGNRSAIGSSQFLLFLHNPENFKLISLPNPPPKGRELGNSRAYKLINSITIPPQIYASIAFTRSSGELKKHNPHHN